MDGKKLPPIDYIRNDEDGESCENTTSRKQIPPIIPRANSCNILGFFKFFTVLFRPLHYFHLNLFL